MSTRQAIHAARKRRTDLGVSADAVLPLGRRAWKCPKCNGAAHWRAAKGRRCLSCDPPKPRGRPQKKKDEKDVKKS